MERLSSTWASVERAFSKRVISLLGNPNARFYVSLLKLVFSGEDATPVDTRLAETIDYVIEGFVEDGYVSECPVSDGRPMSGQAVLKAMTDRYRWVERHPQPDGTVTCRLTADAAEAIRIVDSLNEGRSLMTGSRMETIFEAVRSARLQLDGDYETGLARRQENLDRAQADLDAFVANHGAAPLADYQVADIRANVASLISDLPAEIARYEEVITQSNREFTRLITSGDRPVRELIDERLGAGGLPEHAALRRSYEDAIATKASYERGDSMFEQLSYIDDAAREAGFVDHGGLCDLWGRVTTSIASVAKAQSDGLATISRAVNRSFARDTKEMSTALSKLERACLAWAARRSPRGHTSMESFATARGGTDGPITDLGSPRLAPTPLDVFEPVPILDADSMRDMTAVGAPRPRRILARIRAQVRGGKTVSEAFNELPPKDRRLCEPFGLIVETTAPGAQVAVGEGRASWHVVDADGREVVWQTCELELPSADPT